MTSVLAVSELVQDVRDAWDLWYAFIVGLPTLIAAVGVVWHRRDAKTHWAAQDQKHDAVLDQVRNSHPTNLRDDIDSIKRLIESTHRETCQELRQVRDALNIERQDRIEGDQLLKLLHEREHKA